MLGDTAEKSKNPLKKAMRRRNAKTVTFNPPTYYEAHEPDWSDIEAENEGGMNSGNVNPSRNGNAHVEQEAIASSLKRETAPIASGTDARLGISDRGKQCAGIQIQAVSDNSSRCRSNPREDR